jgi:putative oxidoreductase
MFAKMQSKIAKFRSSLAKAQRLDCHTPKELEIAIMIDSKTAPYGTLLLRVSLGVMFIAHSAYLKAFVFTLPGTAAFFSSLGLPPLLAYVVFSAEVVGGVMLIAGLYTRWVALALVPVLLGAAWAHAGNGWLFSAPNGGWEYPVFLVMASLVLFTLGDGAYALKLRTPRTVRESPSLAGS